jgi:hypothetical protein
LVSSPIQKIAARYNYMAVNGKKRKPRDRSAITYRGDGLVRLGESLEGGVDAVQQVGEDQLGREVPDSLQRIGGSLHNKIARM